MSNKQKKIIEAKPIIKADPAHNSFVYANDALMQEDKRSHPIKNGTSVSQRARIRQKNQPNGEPNLNLTKKKHG